MSINQLFKKSFYRRLLMFFTFVPTILFLIFFNKWNYIFINLVVIISSGIATIEFNNILKYKKMDVELDNIIVFILGISPPLITYINLFYFTFSLKFYITLFFILLYTHWIYLCFFIKEKDVMYFLNKALNLIFILFYPGALMSFIVGLSALENASWVLFVFLFLVSGNDTFAYIFGYFLGKYSYRPTIISPNKTFIGFIGGIFFTIMTIFVASYYGIINADFIYATLVGIFIGALVIIGDLFESGLKRSVGIKDSGNIIIGRGGMLDSIDSLIIVAPFFYLLLTN